ncbi:MAG: SAM-dependent methyltransferase [Jaaginema sp. PMC 1079.18]|nr:SAM-dependent methyltransferase [Jaaginema sp. PMC 1080.18]MEC4852869.1 SAM-dependent methyltransferase [Jaaginema sp. PMC 1079.18]MEC4866823.1 SAM-dependent methyltransferase [Jaaginema sp. PMC 1078.18]
MIPSQSDNPTEQILESHQRLSQSLLWQLERNYFDQQGIQAWNTGAVPHYVTSNPTIARAYAEVILAHLRDRVQSQTLNSEHPLYILELGAGCGRFAFHCLRYLERRLPHLSTDLPPVVYVMSDFTQTNLDYWQQHSHLQPFVEKGLLDFAIADATRIETLHLTQSGYTLTIDTLKNPLIAIANYFFDCLPQDLFTIQNNQLYESLVTLITEQPQLDPSTTDLIDYLKITYSDRAISADYYENPHFNAILAHYQTHLTPTALLFPWVALDCICQLHQLAQGNLLLLSADKGYSRLQDLLNQSQPTIARHGQGFSLMVNYHAIGQYTQHLGGTWLTSGHQYHSININCFLFGDSDRTFPQTQQVYRDRILTGGPDDFFTLKKAITPHYNTLSISQILAYLRLSHWDFNIFLGCFPTLFNQLEDIPEILYPDIFTAIQHIWDNYFPIQEKPDLAFLLGMVLYNIKYFPEALDYFDQSQQLYGDDSSTLFNMAMCHYRLRQLDLALNYIQKTLTLEPNFEAAKAKRIQWQAEQKRLSL